MLTPQPNASKPKLVERILAHIPPLSRTLREAPLPRDRQRAYREILLALLYGVVCHFLFAVAVIAMILGMWHGMSVGMGTLPSPLSWVANMALIMQFPITHSLLLTRIGQRTLRRLAPFDAGTTLSTTTYAIIASAQLIALFVLWTPSGVVYWSASGWSLWVMCTLYGLSWAFLVKASWDAGAEVQSGILGWMSLFRSVKPQYPPMPTKGTFKFIRQPIYLAFALTTWTVPTWTPDQLLLASTLTLYCALGPLLKERRFNQRYQEEWLHYKSQTPYWFVLPWRLMKR